MNELSKLIDRIDKLLFAIIGFSFSVPTIAGTYGLDARLMWVPVVFYAIWVVYKAFLPTLTQRFPERAIVEKTKGVSYVFFLGATFIGNYIMMVILPRTLDVFLIGTFIIASTLRLLLTLVPIRFFRKEIIHMSEKQEREIYRVLTETASASIFLSISVLTFTVEFVGGEDFSLLNVILTLAIGLILFVIALFRERKASSLTHELAVSLINSGWRKKYEKMRKS